MENQKFKCTGDCLKCLPIQRQYCTCQFTYNTMRMIEAMQGSITELKAKMDAIQGNEATLFDPMEEPISQEGDGEEE